jgi:hypothetical protein
MSTTERDLSIDRPGFYTLNDPFADSTADGLTLSGDPFPLPTNGYTIGTAGEEDFGVGTELDENTLLTGTIHSASGSIM